MVDSPGYLLTACWYSFADHDMFSRFAGIGIGHGKLGGDAPSLVIEDGDGLGGSSSDDNNLEIQAGELHEGHDASVEEADNEGGDNDDDEAEGDNNDDNDNDNDDSDDNANGDNDDDLSSEGDDFEDEDEEGSDGEDSEV